MQKLPPPPRRTLVSIIVPVYNVDAFLPRCIDSILAQTYQNLEIILVDNAATETCLSICEKYAAQDNRIKIIHLFKNIGPTGARSAGITHATGDFIGFCDSDDWFKPDAIETLLDLHQQTGADIVWGQLAYYKTENPIVEKFFAQDVNLKHLSLEDILSTRRPFCWDKLYARHLVQKGLQFNTALSLGEDIDFVFHAAQLANFTAFTEKVVYCYFLHPQSTSHVLNIMRYIDAVSVWERIYSFCKKYQLRRALQPVLEELIGLQCIVIFAVLMCDDKNEYQQVWNQTIRQLRSHLFTIFKHKHMRWISKCFITVVLLFPQFSKWFFCKLYIKPYLCKTYAKRLHYVR